MHTHPHTQFLLQQKQCTSLCCFWSYRERPFILYMVTFQKVQLRHLFLHRNTNHNRQLVDIVALRSKIAQINITLKLQLHFQHFFTYLYTLTIYLRIFSQKSTLILFKCHFFVQISLFSICLQNLLLIFFPNILSLDFSFYSKMTLFL